MSVLVWLLYFGLTAGIIAVDAKMQREKARREGQVDFADRRILQYILLGIICGPLPLLFYFGTTRKSAQGWLLGVGAVVVLYVLLYVIAFFIAGVELGLRRMG
jgi:hypothetical protein